MPGQKRPFCIPPIPACSAHLGAGDHAIDVLIAILHEVERISRLGEAGGATAHAWSSVMPSTKQSQLAPLLCLPITHICPPPNPQPRRALWKVVAALSSPIHKLTASGAAPKASRAQGSCSSTSGSSAGSSTVRLLHNSWCACFVGVVCQVGQLTCEMDACMRIWGLVGRVHGQCACMCP